jgi:hypothetical protein
MKKHTLFQIVLLITVGVVFGAQMAKKQVNMNQISPTTIGAASADSVCTNSIKVYETKLVAKCLLDSEVEAPASTNLHPMVFGKPSADIADVDAAIDPKQIVGELPKVGLAPLKEVTLLRAEKRFFVVENRILDGNKMILTPRQFSGEALARRTTHLSQLPIVSGYWDEKRIEQLLVADGFEPKKLISETVVAMDENWEMYSVIKLYSGSLNGKTTNAALAMSPVQPESFRLVYAKRDDALIEELLAAKATLQPASYQTVALNWERRDKATPGVVVSTDDVTRTELGLVAGKSKDPVKFEQTTATICLKAKVDAISSEVGTFCTNVLLDTQP